MKARDEAAELAGKIDRLRKSLDSLALRHGEEMDELREGLAALESDLAALRAGGEASEEAPLGSPLKRAKLAASPPPVPDEQGAGGSGEEAAEPGPAMISPAGAPMMEGGDEPSEASPSAVACVREERAEPFELNFGRVWFVRIGIAILLTGLVFLGNYAYQNWVRDLPNGVRIAALFACSLGLIEAGRRFAKKDRLAHFGEVLLAGGMAFFYFCTFAAHRVGPLKVIESPIIAGVLLFGAAAAVAMTSWLRQTRVTAALGLVMAAYATMLQPIGWMSCFSNVLLAGAGIFFMSRPSWSGPGWVSMLGSYGAYLGWQILGASGSSPAENESAQLWFLPPLWAMFAVPGVVNRFRETMGDRARATFCGINHGLFFLLFSIVWFSQFGGGGYWLVAAVFGVILLVLGLAGRWQNSVAGGVNLAQGLGLIALALFLRLDGYHLALAFAGQSLALALSSKKFRGRTEVVFSLLTALASGWVLSEGIVDGIGRIGGIGPVFAESLPLWSLWAVVVLLAVTSVITARIDFERSEFKSFTRAASLVVCIVAMFIATFYCLWQMESAAALLTASVMAGGLPIASLKFDRRRVQPEFAWAGFWFLLNSLTWILQEAPGFYVAAILIFLVACWFWHHHCEAGVAKKSNSDAAYLSVVGAVAFSTAVPIFAAALAYHITNDLAGAFLYHQIFAIAGLILAIGLRCRFLASAAGLYSVVSLFPVIFMLEPWKLFLSAALSSAAALVLIFRWVRERLAPLQEWVSQVLFRTSAFMAYVGAWLLRDWTNFADWLGLTAVFLTLCAHFARLKPFPETLGLLLVALLVWLYTTCTSPWVASAGLESWRGGVLVVALIVFLWSYVRVSSRGDLRGGELRKIYALTGLASTVLTMWATQMLVWRFGWKPAAVLWTVLGFLYVSLGLWRRLYTLRLAGFILLFLSLAKLFIIDVWDFGAFTRVASFIALGVALILLGLFYSKFTPLIKSFLDDQRE